MPSTLQRRLSQCTSSSRILAKSFEALSRKLCQLLGICLFFLTITVPAYGDSRADGAFLRDITTDYVTPHLKWGKPLAGGPVKVLIITPRNLAAREVVELAQRMSLEYQAVAVATSSVLAVPSVYEATTIGTSEYEKTRELLGKLEASYDVIVMANVKFDMLPLEAQYKILQKAQLGTGLLFAYPRPFPYKKVFEYPTADWKQIVEMVDVSALPESAARIPADKLLKTYLFGKGRIATIAYPGLRTENAGLGLTAFEKYEPRGWKARYENNMALVGRTVQWLAGRKLAPMVTLVPPAQSAVAGKDALMVLRTKDSGGPAALRLRVRDQWNNVNWSSDISIQGDGETPVTVPALAAGDHYLDVLVERDKEIASFGVFRFPVDSVIGSLTVISDKDSYESDEIVNFSVNFDKPLQEDAEVTIRLEALPDRKIWFEQAQKLPRGATEFKGAFPANLNPAIAGAVVCELTENGRGVGKAECVVYFPKRKLEIFPSIIWTGVPQFLTEMYAGQVMRSLDAPIGLGHPGDGAENARIATLFNQRFIPYLTRIGLKAGENGQTLSDIWLGMSKAEADEATGGDGSFYNPKVKAFWKENVKRRMEGLPKFGPVIYTLGDENSFSYDAGYSPADEEGFKSYLKEQYKDIATLNKAWGTTYADFQAIKHLSPKEMREGSQFPMWYEHRRFMEKQYADLHHYLADCVKAIDPHAHVGAEGSPPGELERIYGKLEFWGPYSDTVMNELLRNLGGQKLRTLWWGFGAPNSVYPLWKPLLQGVVNGSAWYSSAIETSGLLGIDFDLAAYYRKLRPHLEALEQGQAQTLIATPMRKDGIAILWSHASHSASVMDERFLKPGDAINVIMNFCYRQGLNFDLVTTSMVEKDVLADYKVLFLCGASALSEGEARKIKAFVEKGGILIADIKPGVLNAYCHPLEQSSVADLFGTPTLNWSSELEMRPVQIRREIRDQKFSLDAEKTFQSPNVPVFSVKEVGKGIAILLNFNLRSAANTASGGTPIDQFLSGILNLGGIKPEIHIEGLSGENLVVRVRQAADYQVVGILADPQDIGKSMTVRLPDSQWVYEVDKALVGQVGEIKASVDSPFKLYSLFPVRQQAPSVSLNCQSISPGQIAKVAPRDLQATGIYRLDVQAPDGKLIKERRKFFLGEKPGESGDIRFAFNDEPGVYQVLLTDVRTGLQGAASITLSNKK